MRAYRQTDKQTDTLIAILCPLKSDEIKVPGQNSSSQPMFTPASTCVCAYVYKALDLISCHTARQKHRRCHAIQVNRPHLRKFIYSLRFTWSLSFSRL